MWRNVESSFHMQRKACSVFFFMCGAIFHVQSKFALHKENNNINKKINKRDCLKDSDFSNMEF